TSSFPPAMNALAGDRSRSAVQPCAGVVASAQPTTTFAAAPLAALVDNSNTRWLPASATASVAPAACSDCGRYQRAAVAPGALAVADACPSTSDAAAPLVAGSDENPRTRWVYVSENQSLLPSNAALPAGESVVVVPGAAGAALCVKSAWPITV